jgi:hypothetical protein
MNTSLTPQHQKTSPYKCPRHGTWMSKCGKDGPRICERCAMEADERKRELARVGGSNTPPVRIGKI